MKMNMRAILMALQIGANSLTGYIMMRVMAHHFGLSAEKDAFDIAYSIPFLLMTAAGFYFMQPVISGAFLKLIRQGGETKSASALFSGLVTILGLASLVLCMLALVFQGSIVQILAPDFSPENFQLTQQVFVIFIPLVATLGLSTLLSAVLIAYGTPVLSELTQLSSRIGFIGFAFLRTDLNLTEVAYALMLSSFAGLGLLIFLFSRRTSIRFTAPIESVFGNRHSLLGDTLRRLVGVVIATAASQGSMAVLRAFYVETGTGNLAAFGYSMSLISPLTILIGQPIAATFGLMLSDTTLKTKAFHSSLLRSCGLLFLISTPIAAVLILAAPFLVALLYEGGSFDPAATDRVVGVFRILALSIPFHIINWLMAPPIMNRFSKNWFSLMNIAGYGTQIIGCVVLGASYGVLGVNVSYLAGVIVLSLTGLLISFRAKP